MALNNVGKGVICHKLANRYQVHVRTSGPNAGHSFYEFGKVWKMQTVPVGWCNSTANLFIGAGGLVNPMIFLKEVSEIREVMPNIVTRLRVDPNTGILDPIYEEMEGGTTGDLHQKIGSTGKGIGAARRARIRRDGEFQVAHMVRPGQYEYDGLDFVDFVSRTTPIFVLLNRLRAKGHNILLEGAQGCHLSLYHGPYPYCTSSDTNAAQLAADVGLPPHAIDKVLLVARTYPIRVSGNSGPMYRELDWKTVSRRMGADLTPERTTVTGKIRRIGEWDWALLSDACMINEPTDIALTFLDYLGVENMGATCVSQLNRQAIELIEDIEHLHGVRVSMIGTGPKKDGKGWEVIDDSAL